MKLYKLRDAHNSQKHSLYLETNLFRRFKDIFTNIKLFFLSLIFGMLQTSFYKVRNQFIDPEYWVCGYYQFSNKHINSQRTHITDDYDKLIIFTLTLKLMLYCCSCKYNFN